MSWYEIVYWKETETNSYKLMSDIVQATHIEQALQSAGKGWNSDVISVTMKPEQR